MSVRKGWAWGTTDGGEWLTILGSHWSAPLLADTAAEAALPEAASAPWLRDRMVLAHVTETWHPGVASGRAYRINQIEQASGEH